MAKHWGGGHDHWTPEVPRRRTTGTPTPRPARWLDARKTSVLPILLGAALTALILILTFALFA